MPLPHWLTRINLVVTNRLTRPLAGWLPWFGVLEHVGRRTGVVRRTPINIFRRGDRYVIALTYGPGVQWLANVEAAGGCRVRMGGRWVSFTAPRRFHDPSRRSVPWIVRVALAGLRVDWLWSSGTIASVKGLTARMSAGGPLKGRNGATSWTSTDHFW